MAQPARRSYCAAITPALAVPSATAMSWPVPPSRYPTQGSTRIEVKHHAVCAICPKRRVIRLKGAPSREDRADGRVLRDEQLSDFGQRHRINRRLESRIDPHGLPPCRQILDVRTLGVA